MIRLTSQFAVHQSSAICASLLCEKPYLWDVDRPNLIGRSPVHLAQLRGYAPVWYPLATHSNAPPLTESDQTNQPQKFLTRTVTALLIQPQLFIRKPFQWSEIFVSSNPPALNVAVGLCDSHGEYDEQLSLSNLQLLCELMAATPKVWCTSLPFTSGSFHPTRILESPTNVHPLDCTNYPKCLLEFGQETEIDQLIDAWAYHRMQSYPDDADNDDANNDDAPIVDLSQSGEGSCFTYPRLIAQLPVPPALQAYLAYRELWPAWKRHTLPLRKALRWYRRHPFQARWFD
ncbi:unnamed protein product [Echinostoma caproni]|uniref:ANK_REP_REGION domain-containing protein n=1 Tax=Echinostoma caproni TaxID=27848 RepID=A0A183AQY0_9TREM|nr:unnamed protein product [Echinostoma caproni]